jgi:excisionase family DNA binding protein
VTDSGELRLFTVEQVATLCKVSVKTVYRAISHGRLRASQLGVGAAYRIRLEDIRDWIDGSTVRTGEPQRNARRLNVKVAPRASKHSASSSAEGRLFPPDEMDGSA